MNFPYNGLFDPPAPVMDIVVVASPTGMESASISAFIDSGADATLVPTSLLEKIGASFVDDAFLRSQWGERRRVRLYLVDIRIGRLTIPGTTVVGDDLSAEVILGRDVLNRLRVILDGPQQRVQVRYKRATRGNREDYLAASAQVPDVAPIEDDRISA